MFYKILFLFAFPCLAMTSTIFIGNGGEVYKVKTDYYVRDLVEADAHQKPYFQCNAGHTYGVDLEKLSDLRINTKLLERKLCDFDNVAPGMGKLLADAINFHSWTTVSDELVLEPDDAPLLKMKDSKRIQAANRTLFNIRLQDHVWNKLKEDHQIALIFHEVVFSLLKINCATESCVHYKQSSRIAREITGSLFKPATFRSEFELNKVSSLIRLAFNFTQTAPELTDPGVIVKTSISGSGLVALRSVKRQSEDIQSYAYSICQTYFTLPSLNTSLSIFVGVTLKNWILRKVSYVTEYGTEYGLLVDGSYFIFGTTIQGFNDLETCSARLSTKIREYSQ